MPDYPEHKKLLSSIIEASTCNDFVVWLRQHKGYDICEPIGIAPSVIWTPVLDVLTELVDEFLGIDLDRIEDERLLLTEEQGHHLGRRI